MYSTVGLQGHVHMFESLQLEGLYVGNLLYLFLLHSFSPSSSSFFFSLALSLFCSLSLSAEMKGKRYEDSNTRNRQETKRKLSPEEATLTWAPLWIFSNQVFLRNLHFLFCWEGLWGFLNTRLQDKNWEHMMSLLAVILGSPHTFN